MNRVMPMILLVAAATAAQPWNPDDLTLGHWDPNDFAVEVVEYIPGSGIPRDAVTGRLYDDPTAALGPPTVVSTGDGWTIPINQPVPVVPVAPANRPHEVVTIGNGGSLTLRFSHPVADDKNNPFGIDLIIFGNAFHAISGGGNWTNGDPEQTIIGGQLFAEPGIVSVSQDGEHWHTFEAGPFADGFAPTAGFRWDRARRTWGEPLNPTRPVDPALGPGDLAGRTVADAIDLYDGAAGGTGFDIGALGLDWVQYVRIDDVPGSNATTEIDAVADVAACGDYKHPYPPGDVNEDCRVDLADLAVLAANWLACTWECD